MCGGTDYPGDDVQIGQGLSPRVRGNQERRARLTTDGRSIPACAGEPNGTVNSGEYPAVYPRVCGGT